MPVTYDSNTFRGGTVPIGNAIWRRNSFSGCRLLVDALPTDFVGNRIQNCQLTFLDGGVTPTEFADWVAAKDPGLAAALRQAARDNGGGATRH